MYQRTLGFRFPERVSPDIRRPRPDDVRSREPASYVGATPPTTDKTVSFDLRRGKSPAQLEDEHPEDTHAEPVVTTPLARECASPHSTTPDLTDVPTESLMDTRLRTDDDASSGDDRDASKMRSLLDDTLSASDDPKETSEDESTVSRTETAAETKDTSAADESGTGTEQGDAYGTQGVIPAPISECREHIAGDTDDEDGVGRPEPDVDGRTDDAPPTTSSTTTDPPPDTVRRSRRNLARPDYRAMHLGRPQPKGKK